MGVTLKVDESAQAGASQFQKEEQIKDAIDILRDRLDGSSVVEPIIRPIGDNTIEIQMPGVSTKENPEILDIIAAPARLEFRKLHDTLVPTQGAASKAPIGFSLLAEEIENRETGEVSERYHFVKRIPEATGEIIKDAGFSQPPTGGWEVNLTMTGEGAKKLRTITEKMINKPLAIVLDGKLYSTPTVRAVLSKNAQISGNYTQREAFDLANVLNNPLETKLAVDQKYEVGPSMAEGARDSSVRAVMYGAIFVVAFMVLYYFAGGIVAILSAIINIIIVLGVLASLGATLTLPGVAALVLTLGMGVDANILIFERLREELKLGKTIRNATVNAFQKVTSTIVDANVTTLITACILIWLGTGPVRGFGYTLAIGICASIFCALVVTRFLVDFLVHKLGMENILGLRLPRSDEV